MTKRVNSKNKGKRGEREAAALLTAAGFPASRSQQYKGNTDAADLNCPRLKQLGLYNEVKRCEQLRFEQWFDQCDNDINDRGWYSDTRPSPLIIHKRNGEEWNVTMRAIDFLELIDT